jgi:hypothetical protein
MTPRNRALDYAKVGIPVFLLAPGSKVPLIPKRLGGHGVLDATTDLEQIDARWSRYPRANIGGATGRGSLLGVALDVDTKAGGHRALARLERRNGALPATLEARTATEGRHLIFTYPSSAELRNTAGQVGEGIDSRAGGGYLVLEPSVTSSGHYRWVNWGTPPAELPAWLLAKLRRPEPPKPVPIPRAAIAAIGDSVLRQKAEAVANARPETRNHSLNASAYYLGRFVIAGSLVAAEVEAVLADAARHAGLDEHEILPTIRSGLSAGMARPRVSA